MRNTWIYPKTKTKEKGNIIAEKPKTKTVQILWTDSESDEEIDTEQEIFESTPRPKPSLRKM